METWMWLVIWATVVGVVGALWLRERRAGRGVDYDVYQSKGQADDEARMRRETHGPNSMGTGGGF